MSPMHILIANNIYPPIMAGGAELMVAWLSEGLAARGHRVTVVSTCGPDMVPYPVEARNGVTIIRFFPRNLYWNFDRQGQKPYRRILWHLRDAWNVDAGKVFRATLNGAPPDVVHTHLIDGFSAAIWRSARQAGVPIVHTAHDYHLLCPRAFLLTKDWRICHRPSVACQLYRAWHLRTARYVDLFVSPSRFLLDRHRLAGLSVAQTAVVPNGIPSAVRASPREPSQFRRFLLLTRLTVEKGVRVVLQAVASMPRVLQFELVIAGRGPLEHEVRQAAAGDPRIKFVGYVTGDAKEALLDSAHCLIIPSLWYENAPVAVIEAAAHDLAVIASRIGGLPELVDQGRTGLLFEPGDVDGLATNMRGLITGEITLADLTTASRTLAQKHSVSHMVDAYLDCSGAVLSADRHAPCGRPERSMEIERAA
jgi:glycosyltransferase involved in cell wall biosynthesis